MVCERGLLSHICPPSEGSQTHIRTAKALTIASHKENKFGLSHVGSGCQGTGVSQVKTLVQAMGARTESDFTAFQERNKEEKRKVKFLSIS